jgi:very-short-patch-repair endonuclease
MRLSPTLSEARLWQALRGSRLGVAFRRQAVIGDHIVDFLAPAVSLVVEVDGGYHGRRCRADAQRDRKLARAGYRVLRLEGELVIADLSRGIDHRRQSGPTGVAMAGTIRIGRCWQHNGSWADVLGLRLVPPGGLHLDKPLSAPWSPQ